MRAQALGERQLLISQRKFLQGLHREACGELSDVGTIGGQEGCGLIPGVSHTHI